MFEIAHTHRWALAMFCFLPTLLAAGCPMQSTREISSHMLVGTWILEYSSFQDNKKGDPNLTYLELEVDNSFKLHQISKCWKNTTFDCQDEYISYTGSWKMHEVSEREYLVLDIGNQNNFHMVEITNGKVLQLVFTVGDPDSGRSIILKKKSV